MYLVSAVAHCMYSICHYGIIINFIMFYYYYYLKIENRVFKHFKTSCWCFLKVSCNLIDTYMHIHHHHQYK